MQVIVDKLLTSYNQVGKGPVVVLLHGWGDTSVTFQKLAAALKSHYTVIMLDLPGFGNTQAPTEAWGLSDYAQFVAAFLKKIDAKPYAVVAHSNGGAIAIRGLAADMLTADKLVLLASSGIRNTYKGSKKALRLAAKTAKVFTAPLPAPFKHKLKRRAYQSIGSDLFVAEHLQETFKRVVSDDVQADAARLTVPTLLIYGDRDEATPPAFGQLFHKAISGSQLHILAGAGHFVHHDQPQKVTTLIEEFLQ